MICTEEGAAPRLDAHCYTPGTWPGSRLPSLYLNDGRALYDLLGQGFTLIAFNGAETGGWGAAASIRSVPLKVLALDDTHARTILERDMILVRPDHHVAWRGNTPPNDFGAVLDRVRGAI